MVLLDWDSTQWQWAAEALILRGRPLPPLDKPVDAAIALQASWREFRLDDPGPPRLLLTNTIGQVFQQPKPCTAAVQWTNRMLHGAAREIPLPYPNLKEIL